MITGHTIYNIIWLYRKVLESYLPRPRSYIHTCSSLGAFLDLLSVPWQQHWNADQGAQNTPQSNQHSHLKILITHIIHLGPKNDPETLLRSLPWTCGSYHALRAPGEALGWETRPMFLGEWQGQKSTVYYLMIRYAHSWWGSVFWRVPVISVPIYPLIPYIRLFFNTSI